MTWAPRTITDQSVEFPNRFNVNGVPQTIEPNFGTVTDAGTTINAAYLQPIENQFVTVDTELAAKETPAGAQAKVDALAGVGNTTTVKALDDARIAHLAENATLAHGGLVLGTLNTDLNKIKALPLKTDTRTTTLTYTSGVLTSVVDADGATTVKTTTLNYTSGVLTSVAEVAGGTTVTTTLNYTSGVLTSVTKAVA